MDHRAVASAYRALEEEGLVEVRGRSGVWVAAEAGGGEEEALRRETRVWLEAVVAEARERKLPVATLRAALGARWGAVDSAEARSR